MWVRHYAHKGLCMARRGSFSLQVVLGYPWALKALRSSYRGISALWVCASSPTCVLTCP